MSLFPDKARFYELLDFKFVCFYNLGTKPSLLLLNWLGVRVDVETMHSNLGIEFRNVLITPSEDIFILLYEMY